MKFLKRTFLFITVFLFLIFLVAFLYYEWAKPSYRGPQSLDGLEKPVDVYFDHFGTPHIYAETDVDAFHALGYLHAQDRLWQMDLIRRIAPGRLSELFGKDLVETDKFFRTLGVHQYSLKSAKELAERNPTVHAFAQAYLDGVNYFIVNGPTPLEYHLLKVQKEPFEIVDIYNVMGYMAFSFAIAHKTDPVIDYITQLDTAYLSALKIELDPNTVTIKSNGSRQTASRNVYTDKYLALSMTVNDIMEKLPVPPFIGSNSWVIAPDKSASGAAVLCNDPHIGYSQPSVWYEAHLIAPSFKYYGYHLAGNPFAVLSHSEYLATGITMMENDDIDFFREKVNPENPNEYWAVDHWETFATRTETIKVKESEEVTIEVKESRHGPIMNSVVGMLENQAPIAAWWTYYQFPNQVLDATFELATAKSIDQVRAGAEKLHAPGINLMYADAKGNIAWWAVAKLVKRPPHVNAKFILDGASGADDPLGFYDFSENPQAENPPTGYVYSANNQSVMNIAGEEVLHPGYYLPDDRAKRIVELLEAKETLTRQDLKDLYLDNKNPNIAPIVGEMVAQVDASLLSDAEANALEVFSKWDGHHHYDTKGAQLYYAWLIHILEYAMVDELTGLDSIMGQKVFENFMQSHFMKVSALPFITNENNPWWDDITTDAKEGRKDIFTKAFKAGHGYLVGRYGSDMINMPWGKFHVLEHKHPIGQVEQLRKYFNVGPYYVGGSDNVPNAMGFSYMKKDLFNVTFGPSNRRIVDFADLHSSESIIPTGQSGNVLSEHYDDQAELYHSDKWRKMLMDKEAIKKEAVKKMLLRP